MEILVKVIFRKQHTNRPTVFDFSSTPLDTGKNSNTDTGFFGADTGSFGTVFRKILSVLTAVVDCRNSSIHICGYFPKHPENKGQTRSDTEKSGTLFSESISASAEGPDLTPIYPVSAPKKVVFPFFPVSRGFVEKSNKVLLFACCFLKISPSEPLQGKGCSSSGNNRKYTYYS